MNFVLNKFALITNVIKSFVFVILANVFVANFLPLYADKSKPAISAISVYHKDGARTETVSSPDNSSYVEKIYNADNQLILSKQCRLDKFGKVRRTDYIDAEGEVVAFSFSGYDAGGRLSEERIFEAKSRKISYWLIYTYESAASKPNPIVVFLRDESGKTVIDRTKEFGLR